MRLLVLLLISALLPAATLHVSASPNAACSTALPDGRSFLTGGRMPTASLTYGSGPNQARNRPSCRDCAIAHGHMLGDPNDWSPTASIRTSSAQAALWGVRNLRAWLERGFTMLRDPGEPDLGYAQIALRDSVRMGLFPGPRIQVAGNFVSVTGGHGDADVLSPDQALPRRFNLADTVDEVARAVRHDVKYGRRLAPSAASGTRPRVINVDGHPAYARAIAKLKESGEFGRRCSRGGGRCSGQRQFIHTLFGIAAETPAGSDPLRA